MQVPCFGSVASWGYLSCLGTFRHRPFRRLRALSWPCLVDESRQEHLRLDKNRLKEREAKIKPQTKGIQKLDLTIPARMRLGVFQSLWRGSKGNPSEDVNVAPKESQFLTLAFHKSSLGEHHPQLQVVPWRRESPLLCPS